ncbi:MAG: class 1 isoprenoid biosynthesis enzyme, partial [Solirubrobacteraceae bacterium]|nr:class 1 isoprenoid biosynthesis enzyme [Solirubrobacteraceae bacterium]
HKKAMLDTIGVLSLPYDIVSRHGKRFVSTLAQTQRFMVSGVVKELFYNPDLPAIKLYDIVISQKTGRLFSLASLWGLLASRCICCNSLDNLCAYKEEMRYFSNYGVYCGNSMQIADDIADLQKVIDGKKTGGFGSEMLLLRCVNVDRLVKEAVTDLMNKSPDLSKIKQFWTNEGVKAGLFKLLDKEILEARKMITFTKVPYPECEELLLSAPGEIADMMIKEG